MKWVVVIEIEPELTVLGPFAEQKAKDVITMIQVSRQVPDDAVLHMLPLTPWQEFSKDLHV